MQRDLPPLTGIRGLAALAVLGFHVHVLLGALPPFARGFLGVDVFFVLSGFLLAWLAAGDPDWRPGAFFRRRFMRILPPLYLQMVLVGLWAAWGATWLFPWPGFAAYSLQFTLAFHVGPEPIRPVLGPWWSIPVELGFYLLFPLALAGLRRNRGLTLVAVALLVLAFRAWLLEAHGTAPDLPFWLSQVPAVLDQFVIGMALGLWAHGRGAEPPRSAERWLLPSGFLLAVAVIAWPGLSQAQVRWPSALFLDTLFALGIALVLAGLARVPGLPARVLSWKPLIGLGTISYSLYLWHLPVILWLKHAWVVSGPATARQAAAFGLSILVATLAWWLVERPLQARGAKPRSMRSP